MICCFIGHRKIERSPELISRLEWLLEKLIKSGTDCFIFGDHSEFNTLCHDTVTVLQGKYPHVRRIHYRTEYEELSDSVRRFFLSGYEDSICPKGVARSGKAAYVKRNRAMIDNSDICLFYYDKKYQPGVNTKSGTRLAFEYAIKKNKTVFNLADSLSDRLLN